MALTPLDLLQIAIVTFFTTFFGRWANRIIDEFETKIKAIKSRFRA